MLSALVIACAATLVLLLNAAPAKAQTCAEACEQHTRDCTVLCQKKAGPRGQQPCKQACDDQSRMCEKACGGGGGKKK